MANTLVADLMKAWGRGELGVRLIVALIVVLGSLAAVLLAFGFVTGNPFQYQKLAVALFVISSALAVGVKSYNEFLENQRVRTKIRAVEAKIRENPEKPQLAWELAQTKLESYLNRNLGQVRSIFWLTLGVMMVGFGFILFGVVRAFDTPEKLAVAIVASASGVLVSFIGGSFLIVYRSTLAQSTDYVSVLERINAVGMAVQILETIPQDQAQLKYATTAEVAKQLLRLYSTPAPKETTRTKGN